MGKALPTTVRTQDRSPCWPVRLTWAGHCQWGWHGIEMGAETSPGKQGSSRYMPGLRGVYAQVLSIGRIRVRFGPASRMNSHLWATTSGGEGE